jgi:hypothetical protein
MVDIDDLNSNWLQHVRESKPRTPRQQTWRDSLVRQKTFCQLADELSDHQRTLASGECEFLSEDDFHPFDSVTLHRVRGGDGEPTEFVDVEAVRDGGMRTRRVRYAQLLEQADMHLEFSHGRTKDAPMPARDFAHAMMRAAVAFLMD